MQKSLNKSDFSNWWRFFHFLQKTAYIHLLLALFADDLFAKIVSLIVKNTPFQNIS